ncbi:hypothetical protein EIN_095200 [Entamoeba invadens IP1]|uniref:Uncharacterized protein n=1 Tax=Entamoeba invadens IP1 TaxID=370355 RepID=A0A0A1U3F6_ENTIV|nr:hypothetical protein EIN_095200 [Entamoeba invadens IP1]ELP87283.1 hypothetical protein EIN_095200 [Entamoeba invadens IP1]|eukprot:XP_004254054.1 hypothetical protein EIN_095200 [Entamoeba invadens IP1]
MWSWLSSKSYEIFQRVHSDARGRREIFDPVENNGEAAEFVQCKSCMEAYSSGQLTRVMKIKNKQENMRKHLKLCKYFRAQYSIDPNDKPIRPIKQQPTGKAPLQTLSQQTKASEDNSVNVTFKYSTPPEGCKMIHVKWNRKYETFDITPKTTVAQIVKDLKTLFGLADTARCFLRREDDKKVLLGHAEILKLVENGEVYKLEAYE